MHYIVRKIAVEEYCLLKEFLYEAIYVPEGVSAPSRAILLRPELQVYIENFGEQKNDNGLVAVTEKKVVGAIWARIMDDYGHIDDKTPSLAISLFKEYRGAGIGTALMKEMLCLLKEKGYQQTSLAVQKVNFAVKLYESVGFRILEETEKEYKMVCDL